METTSAPNPNFLISRIIFTFVLLIIMLLIILILYFIIRIYVDKLENTYNELCLISEVKKEETKQNHYNIIPDKNNIEYNTFDNL